MARELKHNNLRTWELAVDAVRQLGSHAKAREVLAYIDGHTSDYNRSNLHADLCCVSVNCPSRVHYSQNKNPRRSDSGSVYDRLFKEGEGANAVYHIYDQKVHGIWEIVPTASGGKAGIEVRPLQELFSEITKAQKVLEDAGTFDPTGIVDARKRMAVSIVSRRGQQAFRQSLLAIYGGRCAITGCKVADVLEAAHIFPYRGPQTNHVSNGLLLRADIHTLFDLGLLRIHPSEIRVELHNEIADSEYAQFNGSILRLPDGSDLRPSRDALEARYHFGSEVGP